MMQIHKMVIPTRLLPSFTTDKGKERDVYVGGGGWLKWGLTVFLDNIFIIKNSNDEWT